MMINLTPIGIVKNTRLLVKDDYWGGVVSEIELNDSLGADALAQIESFSHAEIIFYFHLVTEEKIETGARHPRNNSAWPKVGILAQRGKNRPNRLGLTIVKILGRKAKTLLVEGLDAVNGTPVLDIKPIMREFMPREADIQQPQWASVLMKNYWSNQP